MPDEYSPEGAEQSREAARRAGVDVPPDAAAWQQQHDDQLMRPTRTHGAVLPGPVAPPTRGEVVATDATHYVVLHKQLGPLSAGDVVTSERLRAAAGDQIQEEDADKKKSLVDGEMRRYLQGGAVRPANEFESGRAKVTLPPRGGEEGSPGPRRAVEEESAAKDREIARLKAQLAQAQEQVRQVKADGVRPADAPQVDPEERRNLLDSNQKLQDQCQELLREREQWSERCRSLEAQLAEAQAQGEGEQGGGRKRR